MHKAVQYRIEAFESYTLYLQKQFLAAENLFAVSRGALRKLFPGGGDIFRPSLQYAHNKMNV